MSCFGKLVKVYFKSGSTAEGRIEEWNDTELILRSVHSLSLLYIYKPSDNILMVHVFLEDPVPQVEDIPDSDLDTAEEYTSHYGLPNFSK